MLLLFVPNFNTERNKDGFIDQSYLLFLKYICGRTSECQFQEKMAKRAI